jgi:RNA polymerase sigma factor (sigma-70 family)
MKTDLELSARAATNPVTPCGATMPNRPDEILPTRASLLHRLKDWGDDASWQQFFDTYWNLIYGVARKTGLSDADAQDVVQETLVAVARHMPGFRYDEANGQFKKWLLNMTRWRIIDHARKCTRRNESALPQDGETCSVPQSAVIDPSGNALDAIWEAEWHKTLYEAALATVRRRVEPHTFQLFDFYVNKEWAAAKVASTFDASVEQVYLAKHRVAEMLASEVARLERHGV